MNILGLRLFLFFKHPYLDKRYSCCQPKGMIQLGSIYALINHLIVYYEEEWPKIDPHGTPLFISPASEKTSSSAKHFLLFERYDSKHLMAESLVHCDLVYQRYFLSQPGLCQCESLCPFFSK